MNAGRKRFSHKEMEGLLVSGFLFCIINIIRLYTMGCGSMAERLALTQEILVQFKTSQSAIGDTIPVACR